MADTQAIADFLTARIDEDESNGTDLVGVARKDWHARWVAECNAKRLIVDGDPGFSSGQDLWDYYLRALALPYADHPDYRQEWKP